MLAYILLGLLTGVVTWDFVREEFFFELRQLNGDLRARIIGSAYDEAGNPILPWRMPEVLRTVLAKLTYLPLCDYCLAHWVALVVLVVVRPAPLAFDGISGYVIGWTVIVATSALWTSIFGLLRKNLH